MAGSKPIYGSIKIYGMTEKQVAAMNKKIIKEYNLLYIETSHAPIFVDPPYLANKETFPAVNVPYELDLFDEREI